MARKLKVFRTVIGFHDAYVAAPSQKAAVAAWGADANLFARGVAELVTDEALAEEPLAHPGKVIKRLRGTEAEHLAALEATGQPRKKVAAKAARAPRRKSAPRPDHRALDEAENELAAAEREMEQVAGIFREREHQLAAERRAAERTARDRLRKAQSGRNSEKTRYEKALSRWHG
jgi:hypothetical protein